MSSCSTNVLAEAGGVSLAAPHAAPAAEGDEAPNGQHHLLRHVLSATQCSEALRHFGTADSKAAARMVNRMSQRELRDMFAKVYTVHTNSNNNTWLRRKLLEAVGASRRFYAAANRTGRAKGARRPPAALAPPAAPRPRKAAAPATTPRAAAAAPHHARYLPHAAAAARILPAGSPRALAQRMRPARVHPAAGSTTAMQLADVGLAPFHHHQQQQLGAPPPPSYRPAGLLRCVAPHHSSDDGATCSDHSGSEAHPAALAPHGMLLESPTSAAAAAMEQRGGLRWWPGQPLPATGSAYVGSHGSVMSSQFAPILPPGACWALAPQPAPPCRPPSAFSWDRSLPHVASLPALPPLLGGYAVGGDAAQLPPLVPTPAVPCSQPCGQPSDLAPAFRLPWDAVPPAAAAALDLAAPEALQPNDDWLTWDGCQLPALF